VVHFAPEEGSRSASTLPPLRYVRADIHPRSPEVARVDITAITFEDEDLDVILYCRVVEHVWRRSRGHGGAPPRTHAGWPRGHASTSVAGEGSRQQTVGFPEADSDSTIRERSIRSEGSALVVVALHVRKLRAPFTGTGRCWRRDCYSNSDGARTTAPGRGASRARPPIHEARHLHGYA